MAHLYAVLHRSPQVSNKPLRLDDMSDDELLQTTRFTRSAVDALLSYVEDDLQRPTHRAHALPPDSQLIAALQFYASGSFQWIVGRSCRILAGWPLRNPVTAPRSSRRQSENRPIFFARPRSSLVLKPFTVFAITESLSSIFHLDTTR